jgi:Alpha/beta hydrolase
VVSPVGLAELLAADPVVWQRAAVAWAALAADLDLAYDEFDRGRRQVEASWPSGDAAAAALGTLTAHGHELSAAEPPARRIADALERHAYAVGELRDRAGAAILAGERAGLRIDRATGRVSAPTADRCDYTGAGPGADIPPAQRIARLNEELAEELADLVGSARRLDAQTALAIRSALPSPVPGYGFGDQPALTVDRATVAQESGRSAGQVRDWWQGLGPEQREQVIRDDPDLVGWLNGVPAVDRDRANRANLVTQLDALQSREADLNRQLATAQDRYPLSAAAPRTQLDAVHTSEAGLLAVDDQLDRFGDRGLLIGIDGQGDGRAIVALGDPDTARHTAVFVPGINTDLLDISGDLDRVDHLEQAADEKAPDQVAVVYWLGYDPPGFAGALGDGASHDGAAAFTPFVDGLRASHQLSTAGYQVTAIGHSYGSTVIADSALSGQLHVDDIVTAGSPGMHTDHAANLHLDPRHVWGGVADDDPIGGRLGALPLVHGQEPTDPAFGDNRYRVDTHGHGAYWTPGSQSLDNQADIMVGRYDQVTYDYGSAPVPTLHSTMDSGE